MTGIMVISVLFFGVAVITHQAAINDLEVDIRELKERLAKLEAGTTTALDGESSKQN